VLTWLYICWLKLGLLSSGRRWLLTVVVGLYLLVLIRFYFHRSFFAGLSFLLRFRVTFVFIKVENIRWYFILLVLILSSLFSFMFHFMTGTIGTVLIWTLYSERGLTYLIHIHLTSRRHSALMLSYLCFTDVTWSFLDRKRTVLTSLTTSGHRLIITSFYTFLTHHGYVQLLGLLSTLFILTWNLLFSATAADLFSS